MNRHKNTLWTLCAGSGRLGRRSYLLFEADGVGLEVSGPKNRRSSKDSPHLRQAGSGSAAQAAFYSLLRRPGGYALHLRAAWPPETPPAAPARRRAGSGPASSARSPCSTPRTTCPATAPRQDSPADDLADLWPRPPRSGLCRSLLRRLGRERPSLAGPDAHPGMTFTPLDRWPARRADPPYLRSAGRPGSAPC